MQIAIGTYDHTKALKDGSVTSPRISFDFIEVSPITRAFRHMAAGLAYDVSEMALATYMLARSFDEVGNRIAMRGSHVVPFVAETDAGRIATAFRNAIYGEEQKASYFDIPLSQFMGMIYSKRIVWAPDGDEAFDDGSYVLQFDVQDQVRLIAFKTVTCHPYDLATIREICLPADEFYGLLQRWHGAFENEWASLPKRRGTY